MQKYGLTKCCCDSVVPPTCTCDECETDQHYVPCCLDVSLSGLDACAKLNGTWSVKYNGSCGWSCNIPNACTGCGDTTLSVSISAGMVTAVVGGYEWEMDLGDCGLSGELTIVTSAGGSDPTCSISPKLTGHCVCSCTITCSKCVNGKLAAYLEVVISGLVDQNCSKCDDVNGTYLIPLTACARWYKCYTTPSLCVYGEDGTCTGLGISVELLKDPGQPYGYEIIVNSCVTTGGGCAKGRWLYSTGSTAAQDCINLHMDVNSSSLIEDGVCCNFSGATLTITAVGELA